jgi:integrase
VWEVRVFAGRADDGRPHQISRTVRGGRRAALKVAAELESDVPSLQGSRTVSELLELWQELHADHWASLSRVNQKSRARLVAAGPLGRMKVAALRVEDIDRWMLRMRRDGVGAASIRNQLSVLRAALSQAVKWDWIDRNPAAMASRPSGQEVLREGMPDEAVAAVIAAAPHQAAALAFRISAVTGARRAELAALRWEDLVGDKLIIKGQIIATPGATKGSAPTLERRPTKSRQVRTVTLDHGTLAAIEAWGEVHRGLGPWLLALGDRPPSPDALSWWWRHARAASGIDSGWRLHDLRHWSATTAIGMGTDIRTVANRLGHSNPSMTLKVYAHALANADAAAAAALGKVLDG